MSSNGFSRLGSITDQREGFRGVLLSYRARMMLTRTFAGSSGAPTDNRVRSHSARRTHYFASCGTPSQADVTESGAGEGAIRAELASSLVEAESVGHRGRFPAAGDPELGEDARHVEAGGRCCAAVVDLPVRPAAAAPAKGASAASTSASRRVSPSGAAAGRASGSTTGLTGGLRR